jgi:thiol:disulfide interchange protein DsbD
MSFMGLASYLAVGLFSAEKPHGLVWKYVDSYANPTFESGSDRMGPSIQHGGLEYALDFEKAFAVAEAENKPVFLDFTGVNCVNCRFMEKGPMAQPEIKDRLSRFVRVQLFTDSVPKITDASERERLRAANVRLQEDWFGDVSLPSYVVIPPDRSVLKDSSKILAALAGKNDESVFAQFLDHGWKNWQQVQASRVGRQVGKR